MGEYARLNRMLDAHKERLAEIEAISSKTESDYEYIIDLKNAIGEIEGALLEMADIDGLDDPYEAFDY